MKEDFPVTMLFLGLAALLFMGGLALLGWLFSYQAVLYKENIFLAANPAGLLIIVIMISVSGFYMFRISVEIVRDYFRG